MAEVVCDDAPIQGDDPGLKNSDSIAHTGIPKAFSVLHVNDLPPEALSAMFHAFIDISKNHTRGLRPVLLVCKYWHNIATRTPQLWTDIHVLVNRTYSLERKILFARLCVRNSGSLPLDITIDMEACLQDRETYSRSTSRPLPQLFRALGGPEYTATARWRSLDLKLRHYPGEMAPAVSALFEAVAPNLERISIGNLGQNSGAVGLTRFLQYTPRLSLLEVDGDIALSTIAMTNAQTLEHLKMQPYSPGSHLTSAMLSRFSKLRSLHLQPAFNQEALPFPGGTLSLPRLESLIIGHGFTDRITTSFELPSLRRLTLRSYVREVIHLPKVMPIEFAWDPPFRPHSHEASKRAINVLFGFYTSAELFILPMRILPLLLNLPGVSFSSSLQWIELEGEFGRNMVYTMTEKTISQDHRTNLRPFRECTELQRESFNLWRKSSRM